MQPHERHMRGMTYSGGHRGAMWGAWISKNRTAFWFWAGLCAALFASRLCHCGILWADEDYHIAAGIQALYGRMPYRDLWYDKPVLNVLFYLLLGAPTGCFLRLAGAAYACGACTLAYRFASRIWTKREGYLAAALLAFSLIFYLPTAVMPLQPDTLMIAPHLAAIYFAWFRRPFWAGVAAAIAFLFNVKGLFVLASCVLAGAGGFPLLLLGFALPNAAALGWLYWSGAIPDYWRQVWVWGVHYSRSPMSQSPAYGVGKILNWAGFHSALVIGAAFTWRKDHEPFFRLAAWTFVSTAAAAIGWRFAPHYFNQVLPPLVISAARGISMLVEIRPAGVARRTVQIILAIALVIPGVRFGPRYALLARDNLLGISHQWSDLEREKASRRRLNGS